MRGKAKNATLGGGKRGITPAYAGKSRPVARWVLGCRDHPRVCGEKVYHKPRGFSMQGSPPRMRGKVPNTCVTTTCCGITPAYAGKSYTRTCYAYNVRDHPRVCGEKSYHFLERSVGQGSPPRMRGKARSPSHRLTLYGITPAYAGKSFT